MDGSTQASLSFTISQSLLKLMSTESVMPSNHLIPCRPLLLLLSIFPSIRVFSNESVLRIRWPKYWNFSFSISPSNEYSGLISFRMDWLDLHSPRDSQESSPTPQFKTINVSAFSLFYGPTLTSIYDCWKNHNFDYMDLLISSQTHGAYPLPQNRLNSSQASSCYFLTSLRQKSSPFHRWANWGWGLNNFLRKWLTEFELGTIWFQNPCSSMRSIT